MKAISFLKIAVVAAFMVIGISVSAPAQAATASWSGNAGNGPTLYQTNWYYTSGIMSPPSGIPITAHVSYLSWSANFTRYPSGLQVFLCSTNSPCYYMGGASGGGYVTAGTYSPRDQFQFLFRDYQSTTYTYASHSQNNVVGGGHQLFITYQY